MKIMKKIILLTLLCSLFLTSGLSRPYRIKDLPPKTALEILQKAYPNEIKEIVYDHKWKDWAMIAETYSGDSVRLFWEEGKLLTEEQIPESHKYRSQFYGYPKKMKDPADMDDRYIAELKTHTSKEVRKNGAVSSPVFFDTLYDARSQESIEKRLTRVSFLGRRMTVHEKIAEPLARGTTWPPATVTTGGKSATPTAVRSTVTLSPSTFFPKAGATKSFTGIGNAAATPTGCWCRFPSGGVRRRPSLTRLKPKGLFGEANGPFGTICTLNTVRSCFCSRKR